MKWNIDPGDPVVMQKAILAGSIVSGIALFALSIVAILTIGLLLGALVITEKVARECSNDNEQDRAQVPIGDGTLEGAGYYGHDKTTIAMAPQIFNRAA